MLLYIFQWLSEDIRFFSVFNYLSLRAVLAALTAMAIGFAAGPAVIARLRAMKIGQAVRGYGPKSHLVKDGTPTMGGALILVAIGISTLLWMDLSNRFVWVVLFVTLGYGAIGWTDDYRKVVHHNPEGMSAREKFAWQSVIGLIAAVYLAFTLSMPEEAGVWSAIWAWIKSGFTFSSPGKLWLTVPFFKQIAFPFGVFGFVIFTYIVIVGTSNAVNLTDGLDGLAAGSSAIIGVALGILAYMSSHFEFASFLNIMFIPGAEELVVFAAAFIGATVGFLWYNAYPAQVFMGDTGSLTLGGIIAVFAIIIRKELLIPILCGIFLVENLSVLMQTFYFKYTKKKYGEGRRIFKMAPLHHHFQKPGNAGIQALIQKPFNVVPESKIVVRFWLIGIILACLLYTSPSPRDTR